MKQVLELPPLPGSRRSAFASTVHEGKLYVIGGHSATADHYPSWGFSSESHVFDIAENRWDRLADFPIAAQAFRVIAHAGFIYAFGGFIYDRAVHLEPDPTKRTYSGCAGWAARSTDCVYRYDILRDKWDLVATMPRRRSSHIAAKIDERVYLIGGWDGTPWRVNESCGRYHQAIDTFDLRTESFVPNAATAIPPRRAFGAAVVNGQIVLLGGQREICHGQDQILDRVEVYDPRDNGWNVLQPLPCGRYCVGFNLVGDRLIVAGGKDSDHRHLRSVEMLINDDVSKGWIEIARLPVATMFCDVIELARDTVGIIGGHPNCETDYAHNRFFAIDLA